MKNAIVRSYAPSATMEVYDVEKPIIEPGDRYKTKQVKMPGTISLNGLIIDASDKELFFALRNHIQLASEEERSKSFGIIRERIVQWTNLLRRLTGKEIIDTETAEQICDTRGVIKLSLFHTAGATEHLKTFTELDKEGGKPIYTSQNMQTMFEAAKYLEVYLSKVDVSAIDPIRMGILRKFRVNPNEALYLSDGQIADIPDSNDAENKKHSQGIIDEGKRVLEKWSKGIEMITISDIYILRAYLKYFEEYAVNQKKDISRFRQFITRGKDADGIRKAEIALDDLLVGKSDEEQFAYDIYSIAGGRLKEELRPITEAFGAETRREQYAEVFQDLKTALEIAEKRMSMNLENTEPIYKNITPDVANTVMERARKIIAQIRLG
jgi:hypothetical protein